MGVYSVHLHYLGLVWDYAYDATPRLEDQTELLPFNIQPT